MSPTAQKQLAKGYEARDMQYGGRRKVVQLKAVELQEPPGETDELEIRALLPNEGQGIPTLPWRDWGRSPLAFTIIDGKTGSNRDHKGWGK